MTAAHALERLRDGGRVVVAQLVEVEGSAPLSPGATMLIDEAGSVEGSITGGCVESAVVQAAERILREGGPPLLMTFGIADELAGTVGLTCGGTVHVFIHELDARAAEPTAVFLTAVRDGDPAGLATLLDGERAGAKLAVVAAGRWWDRSATDRCWTATWHMISRACSSRAAARCCATRQTARSSAPSSASTSTRGRLRRRWSCSARSTSPRRSRRWPERSATA